MMARVGACVLHGASRHNARGFTLVEFMVAMALGLVIMLAVSEIFVNNSQTRREIEQGSRQIENGRFALQLLTDEISNAGFFGESTGHVPGATAPAVCLVSEADVRLSMALPVSGGADVSYSDAPDCLKKSDEAVKDFKDGGSYLAIRRASTCAVGTTGCDLFKAGSHHLQVAACQTNDTSLTAHGVGHVVLSTVAADMNALTRTCSTSDKAPVYRYLSHIYYVTRADVLARAELEGNSYSRVSLVEGIERLYFEYGLDGDGDGVADEYVRSVDSADWADWADVVAVRVILLARTLEATPGYVDGNTYELPDGDYEPGDGFKRQLYSTVVRVNNVAGRRE